MYTTATITGIDRSTPDAAIVEVTFTGAGMPTVLNKFRVQLQVATGGTAFLIQQVNNYFNTLNGTKTFADTLAVGQTIPVGGLNPNANSPVSVYNNNVQFHRTLLDLVAWGVAPQSDADAVLKTLTQTYDPTFYGLPSVVVTPV